MGADTPAGHDVGICRLPPNTGVVPEPEPPVGHPAPPEDPDQQQSTLSRGRPPSGTVRLSASSWITPSVKSDVPSISFPLTSVGLVPV